MAHFSTKPKAACLLTNRSSKAAQRAAHFVQVHKSSLLHVWRPDHESDGGEVKDVTPSDSSAQGINRLLDRVNAYPDRMNANPSPEVIGGPDQHMFNRVKSGMS